MLTTGWRRTVIYNLFYRAIVGAGVGQFKSKTLSFHPIMFMRFRNAADR